MNNIYRIRNIHQQPMSISYRMCYPKTNYLTKNKVIKDITDFYDYFSRDCNDAYNFISLEKAINLMIDLEERFSYNKDAWQVILVVEDSCEIVEKECIEYYKNLKVIKESNNKIKELESIILKRQEDNKDKIKHLSKYQ